MSRRAGFTVIEVILAAALLAIFAGGAVGVIIQGFKANLFSKEGTIAAQLATEGLEAARSIKNRDFFLLDSNLCSSGTGLNTSAGFWRFDGSGTSDTIGIYDRSLLICAVQRDSSGNIVSSGGTNDPLTKKVTAQVSWSTDLRNHSLSINEYFTYWKKPIDGGMLVFAGGGTTVDTLRYSRLSITDSSWTAGDVADVDTSSTNRSPRVVRIFSAPTRDEKVLLSRHYDGTNQYIYGQVYNGLAGTWGNVQLLSSWAIGTALNVRNFDGTYLANGDFMVVYSDNTSTPKFRTWNGSSWSAEAAMNSLSGIPQWVVARARPSSNEVMAAFFSSDEDTDTQYFNGGSYTTSNWSAPDGHANNAPDPAKEQIAFEWSLNNPLVGALVYPASASDNNPDTEIWTANGGGGGSFSSGQQTSGTGQDIGSVAIVPRPGANEFVLCMKDAAAAPNIRCLELSHANSDLTPTNPNLTLSTTTTNERSFGVAYESQSGDPAINVYSDNTGTPKLKQYNPTTNTWDAAATSLSPSPFSPSTIQVVRTIPDPNSDNIMIALADTVQDLYTVIWDGSSNAIFTDIGGKGFSLAGDEGSADNEFWFDFAWNTF